MNQSLFDILNGGKPEWYYTISLIFSLIGVLISLYAASRTRDKTVTTTPQKFDLKFLLWDNAKRVFVTLIVMYVIFRFIPFAKGTGITDNELKIMIGVGVIVATSFDQVLFWIMQYNERVKDFFTMDREKYMQKKSQDEKDTTNLPINNS